MNNIPSLTNTRRPTVSKICLAEAMPCDKWFNSDTLVIVFSNGFATSLEPTTFGNKVRNLCGDLVEERRIQRRIHFRVSKENKKAIVSKVFNRENKMTPRKQKITPYKLSKEDKLHNLVVSA